MDISQNLNQIATELAPHGCTLIAVSKTKPSELIQEAYDTGHRDFGENKVQELANKYEQLPKDIRWHMIGHLQRNKVKYLVPFVHLIHGVDSERLLKEIDKQSRKVDRKVECLLQIHIAKEDTKFGFDEGEIMELLGSDRISQYEGVDIKGLMGMATFTDDMDQVRDEFKSLRNLYEQIQTSFNLSNVNMEILSMGMTSDYRIALQEGSNMVRIGTAIFGAR